MKIAHYVSVVSGQKGFENNVSGHIQVPLKAMELLRDAGHEVHLITNEFGPERSMPSCMPEGVPIHYVVDPRNRGGILERTGAQGRGVKALTMLRMVRQMKAIAVEHDLDAMHFWGFQRTVHLAAGLARVGLRCPTVATIMAANLTGHRGLRRASWKRIGAIVTTTDYVANKCREAGIDVELIRHGVIRRIRDELEPGTELLPKHRVLFWRDPSHENGADITARVYDVLAPKYPDVSFDLAVRKFWGETVDFSRLEAAHDNVHVHHFPYEGDISLPKLMLESLCVLMPIRGMSLDPQLVVAESLACGVPVITTDQRSMPEFITPGVNGDLVPIGDVQATTDALDRMLSDRARLREMGERAAPMLAERWNWDHVAPQLESVYNSVLAVA